MIWKDWWYLMSNTILIKIVGDSIERTDYTYDHKLLELWAFSNCNNGEVFMILNEEGYIITMLQGTDTVPVIMHDLGYLKYVQRAVYNRVFTR